MVPDDDKNDSGMEDSVNSIFGRRDRNSLQPTYRNGHRVNKIKSMTNVPERKGQPAGVDQVDSVVNENAYGTPENCFNGMHKIKSLGNLSQYEMSFGTTPQSLTKLKDDLEMRQQALSKRRSLTNLFESNLKEAEMEERSALKRESIFGSRQNGKYKRKFGIGDTKYIGIDDTPENKTYQLTKMKSLGTIPDLVSERISYDPFLTPMVGRRHPASLHNFEGESRSSRNYDDSNGSSDLEDEVDFLRHQPDEHVRFMNESDLMKGTFVRGFRRSYNRKQDQARPTTPLRQSDGYFQMPPSVGKKTYRHQGAEQRSRSSVHSLPSDGKFEPIIRYARSLPKTTTPTKHSNEILQIIFI